MIDPAAAAVTTAPTPLPLPLPPVPAATPLPLPPVPAATAIKKSAAALALILDSGFQKRRLEVGRWSHVGSWASPV
uniref:Uncharacterized protein n=1 Tax=Physcomitrium patens TaxID=3218 RepID=A0A2K1JTZ8_PHYPA|nr:hypothetical protein PHYPA_014769 [Physcomitrium patens]